MRISLLLQREPFRDILVQTLARFWTQRFSKQFDVRWVNKWSRPRAQGSQIWYGNQFLNCLFVSDAAAHVFEVTRAEYSRSCRRWLRPLQAAYVRQATQAPCSRWLSHFQLLVTPAVPNANEMLILPGNQRLRILLPGEQSCLGVPKVGFQSRPLQDEYAIRSFAAACGLLVPEIRQFGEGDAWFLEDYLVATPLNRLEDASTRVAAANQVLEGLRRLTDQTYASIETHAFLDAASHESRTQLENSRHLAADLRRDIAVQRERLANLVLSTDRTGVVGTSLTHGDVQPANILVNQRGAWLIDWEAAGRRFVGYDLLVHALNTRQSTRWSTRLAAWVVGDDSLLSRWTPDSWRLPVTTRQERMHVAALFLLTELQWHVAENAQSVLTRSSEGLPRLLRELKEWQALNVATRETVLRCV